jgi:uncharacterized repeat protein (TIGR01451 family)
MSNVDYARSLGCPVPVTYADMEGFLNPYPWLVDDLDFIFLNNYGYWEAYVSGADSVAFLSSTVSQLQGSFPGKRVIISESGWPTCGDTHGTAVTGVGPMMDFSYGYLAYTRADQVDGFYFEAFDEPWKYNDEGNDGVGACWGYYDVNRQPKSSLSTLLPEPNIGIWVTAPTNYVVMGNTVTYTATLWNNAADYASQVTVADKIPENMMVVSTASSAGTCYAGSDGTVVLHTDIAANTGVTLTIVAQPLEPGTYSNTARVWLFESHAVTTNTISTCVITTDDFRITSLGCDGSGRVLVNFNTSPGQTYTVYSCDNLAGGLWVPVDGIAYSGTGSPLQIVDPTSAGVLSRFYKVQVN